MTINYSIISSRDADDECGSRGFTTGVNGGVELITDIEFIYTAWEQNK